MFGRSSRPGSRIGARSRFAAAGERPPLNEEDADLRSGLASLGPAALRELREVLTWPEPWRDALLRMLVGRPGTEPLAQLIAIADTDKVAQLRLLRAIRDLDAGSRSHPPR
jgi:hypothetical protein